MKGRLFLIPCSISESIPQPFLSPQVSETLKSVNFFLVENLRSARRFISSMKLGLTIDELDFRLLDKETPFSVLDQLMAPLLEGKDMGVLSESGCPGVADPGAIAVQWAHKLGIEVIPLVGPSSLLLALMGSGFNGQRFCFHGYLPIDDRERNKAISQLEEQSAKENQTQLFIETPYRNNKLLDSLLNVLRKDTRLCIARDLTGPSHLLKTQSVGDWKANKPDLNKLPTVFVLYSGVFG